jgi:hypothetical protein
MIPPKVRGPRFAHMIVSVSVPRVLAVALSVTLTFTPAVVGACAALVCAPVGGGGAVVAGQSHEGHHQATAAAGVPDEHAHHASMHGAGHAVRAVVESTGTHETASGLQVHGLSEHDCCSNGGVAAVAATPGANRRDIAAHVDAAVTAFGILAGVAGSGLRRPPALASNISPLPSSAPLVLRV